MSEINGIPTPSGEWDLKRVSIQVALRPPSGTILKWVRMVVNSRRKRWHCAGLSALDGRRMFTWGLSPQAGMGRTVGAQGQRFTGPMQPSLDE